MFVLEHIAYFFHGGEVLDTYVKTIFLIDFENVGNHWADVLCDACGVQEGDAAYLFYSDNSPKAMLEQLEKADRAGAEIRFRKCVTGRNSLDFQLASELGRLAGLGGNGVRYRIVSDDAGYDVLGPYWAGYGIDVSRSGASGTDAVPDMRGLVSDMLDGPMTSAGLAKHERAHVLGCARACMESFRDPARRMEKLRSDTRRIRGAAFLERVEKTMGGALEALFSMGAD